MQPRYCGLSTHILFGAALVFAVSAHAQVSECPVPPNLSSEHAAFLKRSIARGDDGSAGVILGMLYYQGSRDVIKDPSKAFVCYRWAAELGSPIGQTELGMAYLEGQYVPKDPALAVTWIRKAADQNWPGAQVKLYEQGIGVAVDKIEALKWYQLAAKPRTGNATPLSSDTNTAFRQLKESMAPDEVAMANERAAAFVPVQKKSSP